MMEDHITNKASRLQKLLFAIGVGTPLLAGGIKGFSHVSQLPGLEIAVDSFLAYAPLFGQSADVTIATAAWTIFGIDYGREIGEGWKGKNASKTVGMCAAHGASGTLLGFSSGYLLHNAGYGVGTVAGYLWKLGNL